MGGQKACVLVAAAALLGVSACATGPDAARPQDVEFLRGCWVMKTKPGGEVLAFLRLLPPGAGAKTYDGQIQAVDGGAMKAGTSFSFARDGSWLTRAGPSGPWASGRYKSARSNGPADSGRKAAVFQHAGNSPTLLTASVQGNERLLIELREQTRHTVLVEFEGERDGCD